MQRHFEVPFNNQPAQAIRLRLFIYIYQISMLNSGYRNLILADRGLYSTIRPNHAAYIGILLVYGVTYARIGGIITIDRMDGRIRFFFFFFISNYMHPILGTSQRLFQQYCCIVGKINYIWLATHQPITLSI